jgi:hypothetical protein
MGVNRSDLQYTFGGDNPAPAIASPPRPPLVFRVGIVGHRPNRLQHADPELLGKAIHRSLSAVRAEVQAAHQGLHQLYSGDSPLLRAISPLAEGSDRIFAVQALQLDFELCCVMPFAQAEYELDFAPGKALAPDSLAEFHQLLKRSKTNYELDGSREEESAAYGAGGSVVLNQSDLLVVVWDGERQGKIGGTEEKFDEARLRGVPVLWIDARAPHGGRLLDSATPLPQAVGDKPLSPGRDLDLEALRNCTREALEMPKPVAPKATNGRAGSQKPVAAPRQALDDFLNESQPEQNLAFVWKAFRDLIGDHKMPRVNFEVTPFEVDVETNWPRNRSSPLDRLVDDLRPFYAWPDKLAGLHADRYRSTYISAFLLAAVAVALALLPATLGLQDQVWGQVACNGSELAIIMLILSWVLFGRNQHWHERWLEYRLAAELVRHLRLVAPLGGARPFPNIPAHWATYGQPASTWMAWYVRAVERALGLPAAKVNQGHLETCLRELAHLVEGQLKFHEVSAKRCHRIESFLHKTGISFLILTLVCCCLHFFASAQIWLTGGNLKWFLDWLTFWCGFAPAMGAALAGINNQGEFRRIARRSEAMQPELAALLQQIRRLVEDIQQAAGSSPKQFSPRAATLAGDAARLMIYEVLDWRVVLLDRPLLPPA